MPNIKSAKKRVRTTKKKTLRNKMLKSRLRTILKDAHSPEANNSSLLRAISMVDRSVTKGILHKNTAARMKSSLSRSVK